MKVIILCTLAIFSFAVAQQYDEKYDDINLVEVLHNTRLLNRYIDCVMGVKNVRCDKEGSYLAEKLPEAIRTDCVYCTDKQKIGAFKAIDFLMNEQEKIWLRIQNKFDPNNLFCVRNKDKLEYVKTHDDDDFDDSEFLRFFD